MQPKVNTKLHFLIKKLLIMHFLCLPPKTSNFIYELQFANKCFECVEQKLELNCTSKKLLPLIHRENENYHEEKFDAVDEKFCLAVYE